MILHPFHISSTGTDFPEKMNNPFDYEPHPLCIQICKELQTYLENKKEWREEIDRGKMFGVLFVEKPSDIHEGRQLGYLAAYSGQIGGRSDWDDFVPPFSTTYSLMDISRPMRRKLPTSTKVSCGWKRMNGCRRPEHSSQTCSPSANKP